MQAKLNRYKLKYAEQESQNRAQKDEDIRDLKKRYADLLAQKDIQERQNAEAKKKIERYHFEEVREIETLFEKKLRQEGDGYLQLEQEGLEMKQRYEKQITQIKEENERAIRGLVKEFETNLRKVQIEYKESEEFAAGLERYYSKKLEE